MQRSSHSTGPWKVRRQGMRITALEAYRLPHSISGQWPSTTLCSWRNPLSSIQRPVIRLALTGYNTDVMTALYITQSTIHMANSLIHGVGQACADTQVDSQVIEKLPHPCVEYIPRVGTAKSASGTVPSKTNTATAMTRHPTLTSSYRSPSRAGGAYTIMEMHQLSLAVVSQSLRIVVISVYTCPRPSFRVTRRKFAKIWTKPRLGHRCWGRNPPNPKLWLIL